MSNEEAPSLFEKVKSALSSKGNAGMYKELEDKNSGMFAKDGKLAEVAKALNESLNGTPQPTAPEAKQE